MKQETGAVFEIEPSHEPHFEGLSNVGVSTEGLVQMQECRNETQKLILNLCMNLLILNLELDKVQTHLSDPQRLSTSSQYIMWMYCNYKIVGMLRRQVAASILRALNMPPSLASMMKIVA